MVAMLQDKKRRQYLITALPDTKVDIKGRCMMAAVAVAASCSTDFYTVQSVTGC